MRLWCSMLLVSALCACGDSAPEVATETVTVYSGLADTQRVDALARQFTAATGVKVTLKHGDADLIVAAVIANNGSPTADVLLSPHVGGAWRAAEEGGLRALQSDALQALPPNLRDPDSVWFGFGVDVAAIVRNQSTPSDVVVDSYADLAAPLFEGELCLSSSTLAVNRSLIAMLIATMETRPAERLVQGWLNNLALAPFASEEKLLAAIDAGTCAVGIASESALQRYVASNSDSSLLKSIPADAFFEVEAVGVARHARYADNAQRFVEWLVAEGGFSSDTVAGLSGRNVGLAGWHAEDAVKLAARRSYY